MGHGEHGENGAHGGEEGFIRKPGNEEKEGKKPRMMKEKREQNFHGE